MCNYCINKYIKHNMFQHTNLKLLLQDFIKSVPSQFRQHHQKFLSLTIKRYIIY